MTTDNTTRTGIISLEKLLQLMTENPAEIFKLPETGVIKLGQKADFTIINLEDEYEIKAEDFLSKGKNSPFIGQSVYGEVEQTYVNGTCIYSK